MLRGLPRPALSLLQMSSETVLAQSLRRNFYLQISLPCGPGVTGLAGSLLKSPTYDLNNELLRVPDSHWHLLPALPRGGLASELSVQNSLVPGPLVPSNQN